MKKPTIIKPPSSTVHPANGSTVHRTPDTVHNPATPLVSIIVSTKNEEKNIVRILESIKASDYKYVEIIVIDNNSIDKTKELAKKYTKDVFNKGPERSAQRNFGASKAKGDYLLILDCDMELTPTVIGECVGTLESNTSVLALNIPEKSVGEGFWAECKALERSFYNQPGKIIDWLAGARFYRRSVFEEFGGYDEENTGTEDFDLPQRIKERYGNDSIGSINSFIIHHEGKLSLIKSCKKKYYYAQRLDRYKSKSANKVLATQANPVNRYKIYLSNPKLLLSKPHIGLGMLFLKSCEFFSGGLGYLNNKK